MPSTSWPRAPRAKHVFVDKPFTLTVADARRATEACRRADVVGRRPPASQAGGQPRPEGLIDEARFGRVAQIEGNFSADYGFSSTLTTRVWRGDRAEAPGGTMTNLGIHHVDTYQYPSGRSLASWPSCVASLSRTSPIDDVTSISSSSRPAASAYLGTSWVHANRTETITVHGTEAQAWHEPSGARLFLARRGQAEAQGVAVVAGRRRRRGFDRVRAVRA